MGHGIFVNDETILSGLGLDRLLHSIITSQTSAVRPMACSRVSKTRQYQEAFMMKLTTLKNKRMKHEKSFLHFYRTSGVQGRQPIQLKLSCFFALSNFEDGLKSQSLEFWMCPTNIRLMYANGERHFAIKCLKRYDQKNRICRYDTYSLS